MIKINNLNKIYNSNSKSVIALKDINLEIKKGEKFGIIGLSGAGKSTLIRTINRLEEATSGNISINNNNINTLNKNDLRNLRRKVGMIFQHFNLLDSRTVFGNIAFPLEITKVSKEKINERVNELLDLVDLKDKSNSYPFELSGGQKQRVAIARALANEPQILLCDEATSALDPQTTKAILNLLNDIQNKLDLTIVLITHQMEVIRYFCDRVAIIEDGVIIELNTVKELFLNPKTNTAKDFISHLDFTPKGSNLINIKKLEVI